MAQNKEICDPKWGKTKNVTPNTERAHSIQKMRGKKRKSNWESLISEK